MNSTCSMKAWHRCVSLWGPPGRLCTASSVVETGFKICFPPPRPPTTIFTFITDWLGVYTFEPSELQTLLTKFYLCWFEGERIHTAMTLVPIAPPGGKWEYNAEHSLQPPKLTWGGQTTPGRKSFQMKSMWQASRGSFLPVLCRCSRLLGNTVNNLGSQTVYCTALQLYKCPRLSDGFYGRVAAATGRMSRN